MPKTYVITGETEEKVFKKLNEQKTYLEPLGGLLDISKLALELGIKKGHISQVWANENGRELGLPDHPTARFNKEMEKYWGPMKVKGSIIVVLKNNKELMRIIKETHFIKLNTVDDITDF
jgi:hypothetical protein